MEALHAYWDVCPDLKTALFKPLRDGYATLAVDKAAIKPAILQHPQFAGFLAQMGEHFDAWRAQVAPKLKALPKDFAPKQLGKELSENLLHHYEGKPLVDAYDVYQHLMDYWAETMQDDAYVISADGWVARIERIIEKNKKGQEKDKGWFCDLVPKQYVVARFFASEQKAIDETAAKLEAASSVLVEYQDEHWGDDGLLAEVAEGEGDKRKITDKAVKARIKEIGKDKDVVDELTVLKKWQALSETESALGKKLKQLKADLDKKAYEKYPKLTTGEIKSLVVDDKWLVALSEAAHGEVERVSQSLTARVRELALRYEKPLPALVDEVAALSAKVKTHLEKMGAAWN